MKKINEILFFACSDMFAHNKNVLKALTGTHQVPLIFSYYFASSIVRACVLVIIIDSVLSTIFCILSEMHFCIEEPDVHLINKRKWWKRKKNVIELRARMENDSISCNKKAISLSEIAKKQHFNTYLVTYLREQT